MSKDFDLYHKYCKSIKTKDLIQNRKRKMNSLNVLKTFCWKRKNLIMQLSKRFKVIEKKQPDWFKKKLKKNFVYQCQVDLCVVVSTNMIIISIVAKKKPLLTNVHRLKCLGYYSYSYLPKSNKYWGVTKQNLNYLILVEDN